jgi:uridine kinase
MNAEFLLSSLAARPQSEPVDSIKFIYQNAFGCGHLLPEAAVCAENIRLEMEQTSTDDAEPAFEPLGNGLCRLNLRNTQVRALSPLRVARMMRVTAERFQPSPERFSDSLNALRSLAASHGADGVAPRLPFTADALEASVRQRSSADELPRHSERYRSAYRPAYRVVLRRYGEALPLLAALEKRLAQTGRATLALDGNCASGKTTLVSLLAPLYDATVFHTDDFFLPFALRTPERLKTPGGNVHYERFLNEVLNGLLSGEPFAYGSFDCRTGETRRVAVTPGPVVLIEGSYALHPAFDAAYEALDAVKALLTLPPDEQKARILARDGAAAHARFQNEWIPLENHYFKAYHKTQANRLILSGRRFPEDE